MKFKLRLFCGALALTLGLAVQAQSIEEARDAYFRGDYETALSSFRALAGQGNADAQKYLADMFALGKGVPKDYREALHWYRKAAERGDVVAQNNLGVMYSNGIGAPKNEREAVNWFRRAAEQGYRTVQNKLGHRYAIGHGVPQNDREAVYWYRKAAEHGHVRSQFELGLMFNEGRGVSKDYQQAYFWWLLASAGGDKGSAKARDLLEQKLSPAQRAQAQTAARNWQPKTREIITAEDLLGDENVVELRGDRHILEMDRLSDVQVRALLELGEAGLRAMGQGNVEGKLSPATPSRTAPPPQSARTTGTGFRVARGAIVTNHHVVDGCSRLRVNGVAAQVRGSDARSDLALLNASLPGPSTSLRAQRAAIGESVAVAGYPLRGLLSGFNMTTGNLSSLSGAGGDTRLVQITAPVQPGNSGGPLLDSAGNLMGVVVSKLDAIKTAKITGDIPQNVNFAINANVLRSFLDAYSVDYETASSDRAIATTAIADKAKGFTVLVECWK